MKETAIVCQTNWLDLGQRGPSYASDALFIACFVLKCIRDASWRRVMPSQLLRLPLCSYIFHTPVPGGRVSPIADCSIKIRLKWTKKTTILMPKYQQQKISERARPPPWASLPVPHAQPPSWPMGHSILCYSSTTHTLSIYICILFWHDQRCVVSSETDSIAEKLFKVRHQRVIVWFIW